MSEIRRDTPTIRSHDQQAPVVFIDMRDGRLEKIIMTREEADARKLSTAAGAPDYRGDNRISAYTQAPAYEAPQPPEAYSVEPTAERSYEQTRDTPAVPERRNGSATKKIMAKLAVAALVVSPYAIGDTIGTFLQSGQTPSFSKMAENVTELPGQAVEFYQGVADTIQGAKSFTDTINKIKGTK